MNQSRLSFGRTSLFTLLLIAVTACSGGHVSMVYEQGRNPEGTTAEDIQTRLELGGSNEPAAESALNDLSKVGADFNWAKLWEGLRKNPNIFLKLKLAHRERLLSLATKLCNSAQQSSAMNSFAEFVIQSRHGYSELKKVSLECNESLEAHLVLSAMEMEDPENVEAAMDFLLHEVEKRNPTWASLPQISEKLRKWIDKSVSSSLETWKSGTESTRKSFDQLARLEMLFDSLKIDTTFIRDSIGRPLVHDMASTDKHKVSQQRLKDLKSVYPRLADSSELWRYGIRFEKDSPLLTNPLTLMESAKNLCPDPQSSALFDESAYSRFLEFLKKQPTAGQLLLDPSLPCREQLPPTLVRSIVDFLSQNIFPENLVSVNGVKEPLLQKMISIRFVDFLASTLGREAETGSTKSVSHSDTDRNVFFSNVERQNAVFSALMGILTPAENIDDLSKIQLGDDLWKNLVSVFKSTTGRIEKQKDLKLSTRLGLVVLRSEDNASHARRKEVFGQLVLKKLSELHAQAVNPPAKLSPLTRIFQANNFRERNFLKESMIGLLYESLQKPANDSIEFPSLTQINRVTSLSTVSNLLALGNKSDEVLAVKQAYDSAITRFTQNSLHKLNENSPEWKKIVSDAGTLLQSAHKRFLNVSEAESLATRVKILSSRPNLKEETQKWLQTAVVSTYFDSDVLFSIGKIEGKAVMTDQATIQRMNAVSSMRALFDIISISLSDWVKAHEGNLPSAFFQVSDSMRNINRRIDINDTELKHDLPSILVEDRDIVSDESKAQELFAAIGTLKLILKDPNAEDQVALEKFVIENKAKFKDPNVVILIRGPRSWSMVMPRFSMSDDGSASASLSIFDIR